MPGCGMPYPGGGIIMCGGSMPPIGIGGMGGGAPYPVCGGPPERGRLLPSCCVSCCSPGLFIADPCALGSIDGYMEPSGSPKKFCCAAAAMDGPPPPPAAAVAAPPMPEGIGCIGSCSCCRCPCPPRPHINRSRTPLIMSLLCSASAAFSAAERSVNVTKAQKRDATLRTPASSPCV